MLVFKIVGHGIEEQQLIHPRPLYLLPIWMLPVSARS